jgi:hypothetical protein
MHTFQVTIPALDIVDASVESSSRKKAALKLLNQQDAIEKLDLDSPLEVTVLNAAGKKAVFEVTPQMTLSFRCQKVG